MIKKIEFAERLTRLRSDQKLSQNRLASMIGVSGQAISKWENGHSMPDIDILPIIANIFDVTIDYLLLGSDAGENAPQKIRSSILTGYDIQDESMKIIEAMSDTMPREKLFQLAKMFEKDEIRLSFNLKVVGNDGFEKTRDIPITSLSLELLRGISTEMALITSKLLTSHVMPDSVMKLLCCPTCNSELTLALNEDEVMCTNGHKFSLIDGVLDFGYREQLGNCWSYCYKTFDEYAKYNRDYNPYVSRAESVKTFDNLIKSIVENKPKVILDAGTGEGMGIGMLLNVIDWPCTIFLTDLSHRILRYNRRLIEESKSNPFVTLYYLACDLRKVPFKDKSIDCVWSFAGFGNMGPEDMIIGLRESHRILKDNGVLIFDTFTYEDDVVADYKSWLALLYQRHPDTIAKDYDQYSKGHGQWEKLFADMGFKKSEIVKVEDMMALPPDNIFPWENQIMQWVGSSVATCTK